MELFPDGTYGRPGIVAEVVVELLIVVVLNRMPQSHGASSHKSDEDLNGK